MAEIKAVVTTGHTMRQESVSLAQAAAVRLDIPYVKRGVRSLTEIRASYGVGTVLVAKENQLILETSAGELFFHPNMAHLRVKNLRQGKADHMAEAMDLQPGMSVLDCTLGLGADAIVASFITGATGQVTGLEASPLLEAVVRHGLQTFLAHNEPMNQALRRIRTVPTDYLAYLQAQPADSVDIVYFDPMFRHPLLDSVQLAPLRLVADHSPLSSAAVIAARRVARHRVVMKESHRSQEFERLGFQHTLGGRYSRVRFGWLEA
jgi:16S rRNA G966 N2-methylase RsmD